jgi:hypothetical protein
VRQLMEGVEQAKRRRVEAAAQREAERAAERARMEANEVRAREARQRNNRNAAARAMLRRQMNNYGTMLGGQPRTVEAMYQRMVGQVMRRTTFTPTDFKQLGKIVKARSDERWRDVERLIKEWETMVKRRVCRLKKEDMQGIAFGLNINTAGGKKKRAQLCQEIKNKI